MQNKHNTGREFRFIFLLLRNELKMNQVEMAKALNVSQATIGFWETGKRMPSLEKMEEIADYFNVDMDFLYGRQAERQKIHLDNDGTAYAVVPEYDPDTIEIIDILGKIKPEQKQNVLAMLRSFIN